MKKPFNLYKENNEWKTNPSGIDIDQYWDAVVKKEPEYVLEKLKNFSLDSRHLSFAAEYAGIYINSEECLKLLILLLDHKDAIVREGAILGILNFDESYNSYCEALIKLNKMEHTDSSSGVRQRIEDFFERFRFDHDWD